MSKFGLDNTILPPKRRKFCDSCTADPVVTKNTWQDTFGRDYCKRSCFTAHNQPKEAKDGAVQSSLLPVQ